jgi:hypothetical protein
LKSFGFIKNSSKKPDSNTFKGLGKLYNFSTPFIKRLTR